MTNEEEPRLSVRIVEVDEGSEGQRIDNFLLKVLKGVPKSRIYRCLRKGEVRINGKRAKADARLVLLDKVRIPPIRVALQKQANPSQNILQVLSQAVIYEDEGLLVINKPAGIAVHGGSGVSYGVIEAMRILRPKDKHLELVHRLDRDTSGCLMISKKPKYLKAIQKFLSNKHELEKHYLTVVHGRWSKRKQHVDLPLKKNVLASGERISVVDISGEPSRTEFAVVKQNQNLSLLAVKPITGRTHQIRVHCKHTGFPIVGDPKYGDEAADKQVAGKGRMMLHASKLVIPGMFGNQPVTVEADLDEAFKKLINTI